MKTFKSLLSSQKIVLALAIAIMICGVVAIGSASASTSTAVLKIYPNGTLLRSLDNKVYVVKGVNTIQHILDLTELAKYSGRAIINVDASVIAQYQEVFQEIAYPNGTLLRSPDNRIFVLANGKKQYVSSLKELAKYSGRIIYNVAYAIIAKY